VIQAATLYENSSLNNSAAHAHLLSNQADNLIRLLELSAAATIAKAAVHIMRLRPEVFPGAGPDLYWQSFERHRDMAIAGAQKKNKKKKVATQSDLQVTVPSKYAVDPNSPQKYSP